MPVVMCDCFAQRKSPAVTLGQTFKLISRLISCPSILQASMILGNSSSLCLMVQLQIRPLSLSAHSSYLLVSYIVP